MLNFLRVFFYPSVSMQERDKLPKESGVYYLRLGAKIEYIGQSTSLRTRGQVKEIGSTSRESESSRQMTMKGIGCILESCPQESLISLNIQRLPESTLPSMSKELTLRSVLIGG